MIDDAVVDALAVARLTRLVTRDKLTAPARAAFVASAYAAFRPDVPSSTDAEEWLTLAELDPRAPWPAKLAVCSWCAAVWVALGVAVARRVAPRLWGHLARALASAHVAGYLIATE